VPVCVGHSLGTEDQVAGPCLELRVADCEDVLTLEDGWNVSASMSDESRPLGRSRRV
jgi:hypothetical protein